MTVPVVSSLRRAHLRLLFLGLLAVTAACGGGDSEEAVPAETTGTGAMPLPSSATADSMTEAAMADTAADTAASPVQAEPEPQPEPEPASGSTPEPAAAERAEPAPSRAAAEPAPDGDYMLQLGSYRSRGNADAQLQRLVELDYAAVIETAVIDGLTWHRVILRGLPDRSEAERVGESIRLRLGTDYLIRRSP